MKAIVACVALLLAGCDNTGMSSKEITWATSVCEPHQGLSSAMHYRPDGGDLRHHYQHGTTVKVLCRDGTLISKFIE